MITILGKEIPNQMKELTIEQFEMITEINNNKDLDAVDKHLKIFEYLGIPEKDFWDVDISDFIEMVKAFNSLDKNIDYPTIDTIEIDGYTYTAQMKLTVRDTKHIEKLAIEKPKNYISQMMAVMFKREDLTPAEHYAEAHIKHKAKFICKMTADISIPYVMYIANKVNQQFKNAEATPELEPSNA
jgi:hypothetical protein